MGFLESAVQLISAVAPPLLNAYTASRQPRVIYDMGGGGYSGAPPYYPPQVLAPPTTIQNVGLADRWGLTEGPYNPQGPTLTPDLPMMPDFGSCANIFYKPAASNGMRLKREVIIPTPGGGVAYYVHRGKPILFSGDLRLMKRLDRIGRRFASKSGARRRSGKGRRRAA